MTIPSIAYTAEFQRVASLPRRVWSAEDLAYLASTLTEILRTPPGTPCAPRDGDRAARERLGLCLTCGEPLALRPLQAASLYEAGTERGLFGPLGVGEGKTLATLLLPVLLNAQRPLLLLPGGLVEKTQRERLALSAHWKIPTALRVLSYDILGRVDHVAELESYEPDAIICDEVHRLKNKRAAVTRRVARYMHAKPETTFCGLSGSIMPKSLKDFAHLLLWALKWSAPVPTSNEEIEEWAEALDHGVDPLSRRAPGALLTFCTPEDEGPDHVRARLGFRRRLTETPGVVATIGEGERVDTRIVVRGIRHKVAPVTERNFLHLRGDGTEKHPGWQTPDDWELMSAVDVWRHAKELALGLFYVWFNHDGYQQCLTRILNERGHTLSNIARRILSDCARTTESGIELLEARAKYPSEKQGSENGHSKLGTESTRPNMSGSSRYSTGSVISAASEHTARSGLVSITVIEQVGLGAFFASSATERSALWATILIACPELSPIFEEAIRAARAPQKWVTARQAWHRFARETIARSRTFDSLLHVANACDAGRLDSTYLKQWREVEASFTPNVEAVWCDDSPLEACRDWMQAQGSTGGIVWTEHGFFAQRLATFTGCRYFGAGGFADDGTYIEDARPGSVVIASIDANREGKNLQRHWSRNLMVCPPTSAAWWEQTIARTHRTGQEAEVVIVDVLLGCRENFDACMEALAGAAAIQEMTGKTQKLSLADVRLPTEEEIDALRSPRWVR